MTKISSMNMWWCAQSSVNCYAFRADCYKNALCIFVGPGLNLFLRLADFDLGPFYIDKYTVPGVSFTASF